MSREKLLEIEELSIAFGRKGDRTTVVEGVSFSMQPGEKLALVGESGSGKSVTALSLLTLHEMSQTAYGRGSTCFNGDELIGKGEAAMRRIRGRDISMIFQEPMTALNPVYPIGAQLMEPLQLHEGLTRPEARERVVALLQRVGIDDAEKRLDAFPHMLSGGQRQRLAIARALLKDAPILILDEATSALDTESERHIQAALEEVMANRTTLVIAHRLSTIEGADNIVVLDKGRIVEQGKHQELLEKEGHYANLYRMQFQEG